MSLPEKPAASGPRACPNCLRRSHLLVSLGPYIERALARPGFSAAELLGLRNDQLAEAVAPEREAELLLAIAALEEGELQTSLDLAGCWGCCRHDPAYPRGLREASYAPWALIGRGEPGLLAEIADPAQVVAVIGARRASAYGREVARTLGRDLASAGVTVISGMAYGIDACAHRGALEAGRTVAVLGCGPDIAYPAAHRSLSRRIQENGLVLSELPPGTGAWRWAFPARNGVIAGLAGMTVVVEAAPGSGSLLTAQLAAELGRPLGAVPGPLGARTSAGPNELLAEGAHLVRDAGDVLGAIGGAKAAPRALCDQSSEKGEGNGASLS